MPDVVDGGADQGRPPGQVDDGRRRGTVRDVRDPATGRTWRVWATAPVPDAPAGACLAFDAGDVIRRVWGAPPEWRALDDAALLALVEAPPSWPRGPAAPCRAD